MNLRAFIIAVGFVLVGGGLWVFSTFAGLFGDWGSYNWNQQLTVVVETPEGERTGSAVTHVALRLLQPGSRSISAASSGERSNGEAVVVPLPEGRYLFVLRAKNASILPQAAFAGTLMTEADHKRLDYVQRFYGRLVGQRGLSGPLPRGAYPRFVTFDDLSEPATVKLVDPDDLAATFGPGYALKSVTLEITSEAIDFGRVEVLLPWINDYYNKRLDGQRFGNGDAPNQIANSLSAGVFKAGDRR